MPASATPLPQVRKASFLGFFALFLLAALPTRAQEIIPLWKEGAPGANASHAEVSEDKRETGRRDRWLSYVSTPNLSFYPATENKGSVATVLVVPGGGFRYVCIDKEGIEAAEWLNGIGLNAVVLKYRSIDPEVKRDAKTIQTYFGDIDRAMRVLRTEADKLGINPTRIGTMGFSAGAMFALHLLDSADAGNPKASDPVEQAGSMPNFTILIYGAPLPGKAKISPLGKVPVLIVHAADDPKAKVSGAKQVAKFLKEAGVPLEVKIYKSGGHGFGMKPQSGEVIAWTDDCLAWLRSIGMR